MSQRIAFYSQLASALAMGALSGCSGPTEAPRKDTISDARDSLASNGVDVEWAYQGSALTFESPTDKPFLTSGCADDHDHRVMGKSEQATLRERAARRVGWRSPEPHRRDKTESIRILGFNDFHGQLSAGRTVAGRPVGGAAVLASYLENSSSEFPERALIIHAGDHVGASPPASALLQDEPSIQFLNLLADRDCQYKKRDNPRCNVVGTLGNHEFDEGAAEMLRLVFGGNSLLGPFLEVPYRGAAFSYVSANVLDADTKEPLLAPYTIKQLGNVKVGVIGAVLRTTPTIVTPTGVAGLEFTDEAAAINSAVRKLRRRGVNAVVVTIHEGGVQTSYEGNTASDGQVTGDILPIIDALDDAVDVVISGHRHAFTNALVNNANGTPILVTQAFSSSTGFAEVDLEVSRRTGDVVEKTARVLTTFSDVAPGITPDPEVAELVRQAEERTAPLVNRVIGEASLAITRTQTLAGESALGNLIADAQRAATGTDLAFMNPGGIRADLDAGSITWGDLFTIQPFGNSLVRMDLTGEQIHTLLEQQWVGQTNPRLLQVSGLRYTWDAAAPNGTKVVEITKDGQPIRPDALYSVTVNSFIAAGGDNFTVLVDGTNRVGGDVDLDALISYVLGLSAPIAAVVESRIARIN